MILEKALVRSHEVVFRRDVAEIDSDSKGTVKSKSVEDKELQCSFSNSSGSRHIPRAIFVRQGSRISG